MANTVVRYSDAELKEFKALIESKLEIAQTQQNSLQEQIMEIAENSGDDYGVDWVDDSNTGNDVEMLNNMAIRQRRYIQDLQNALIRIRNKVYGVCTVTGELIDKKRLMAVPTTTKSVAAKTGPATPKRPVIVEKADEDTNSSTPAKNKIITRVIRKSSPGNTVSSSDEEEDLEIEDFYNDDVESMDEEPMISLEALQEDGGVDIDEQDIRLRDEGE